jgi:hypothetical protein
MWSENYQASCLFLTFSCVKPAAHFNLHRGQPRIATGDTDDMFTREVGPLRVPRCSSPPRTSSTRIGKTRCQN